MRRRLGFTLIEMLVTLAIASVVLALVAVLARDLARVEERLRVEILGGTSIRMAAARLASEIDRAEPGGVRVESESEIRIRACDGTTVRLLFSRNAITRAVDGAVAGERIRKWAMHGTMEIVESSRRTITLRFRPEGSSRVEVFVLASAPAAEGT